MVTGFEAEIQENRGPPLFSKCENLGKDTTIRPALLIFGRLASL